MRRTILTLCLAASLTPGGGFATGAENGPTGFSKWFRNPFSRSKSSPAIGETATGLQADESTTRKLPASNDELRGLPDKATPPAAAPNADAQPAAPNADASASDAPTAPSPDVQSPVGDAPAVASSATNAAAANLPQADLPQADSAGGESRDEGMSESIRPQLGGAGPAPAENATTPVGRPRFGGGYFGGGYGGRAILAVPNRTPTAPASAGIQADEAPAAETPENALPNVTSPAPSDTPPSADSPSADPPSAASPDGVATEEAVPRAESSKDENPEAATRPTPPPATVVPLAGRTGSSALTPIGVGVRAPETASARPVLADVRAEAEAEASVETPVAIAPVETPEENPPPAVVAGGTVAEVVETGRVATGSEVQPVSGQRETATAFGGRLFRRSPSGRASRVTFGDDDGPTDTESPVPASGYVPPRRVAGGGATRGPVAISPASTPTATRGPASWFAPKQPAPNQPASQQPANTRSAAASQPTATKSSWMFWRSEPVGTNAAPSRTATERAGGITVPPVITEPANSLEQDAFGKDAPARGPADAQGGTVQSASAQGVLPSSRTGERRAAARTPAVPRSSSTSRGTSTSRTVTTSSRATADADEGPSVEIAVPSNDMAKPSISDRMRSLFGGKRD